VLVARRAARRPDALPVPCQGKRWIIHLIALGRPVHVGGQKRELPVEGSHALG
jgi:hypothetical protein